MNDDATNILKRAEKLVESTNLYMNKHKEEPNKMKTTLELLPPPQVEFVKHCIENTPKFVTEALDELYACEAFEPGLITPALLTEWVLVARKSIPEGMERDAIEPRIIIAVAHREGYSLEEICIMTSELGTNKKSHQIALSTLSSMCDIVRAKAQGAVQMGVK